MVRFRYVLPRPEAGKSGADDRDRTGDLVLTKDVLCQLSYIGLFTWPRRAAYDPEPTYLAA